MFASLLRVLVFLSSVALINCASSGKVNKLTKGETFSEGQYYHESSFNDLNRAPAAFSPPSQLTASQSMDPFYIRSQADYNYSLGEAYSLDGESRKAIESFKTVLVYDPQSETVKIRLAKEYLKLGQVNQSIEIIKSVIDKNPKNTDARLFLAGLYTTIKAYPKAIESYEAVLKTEPKRAEVMIYLAAVYSETKEYDKAIKLFEKVLADGNYEKKYLIHYYIGRIREEQKDPKHYLQAEDSYQKAIKLKPEFVDSTIALGSLYKTEGKEDKALKLYVGYQKSKGPNLKIAEILSQHYIEKQKYDEAYEQLEILESQSEDALTVKVKMALILIEEKIYDKAIAKLEEILREAPESDKIRFYLAAVYEEIRQDEKAVEHYRKIPVSSSFYGESVVHAGYLLKSLGKLDDALAVLKEGYENKKDIPQLYAMYATLLDDKKDYSNALEVLKNGIKKFPDNAQIYFYYGTIYDHMGKKDKVIEIMKKVVELDPNHSQGLNYLAFTWVELNENLDEAEKLSRRAVELDPQDGYILDTL
ncbi:MAG: tetratricopeptide repeat protein, partial [Bdellovibrionales bacterium]|nr:tetratricopeptide repeat protein [Bdellovibrionales bacterium]